MNCSIINLTAGSSVKRINNVKCLASHEDTHPNHSTAMVEGSDLHLVYSTLCRALFVRDCHSTQPCASLFHSSISSSTPQNSICSMLTQPTPFQIPQQNVPNNLKILTIGNSLSVHFLHFCDQGTEIGKISFACAEGGGDSPSTPGRSGSASCKGTTRGWPRSRGVPRGRSAPGSCPVGPPAGRALPPAVHPMDVSLAF